MTLLLLVRHAHTDTAGKVLTGWERGVHLSERGRAQAEGLATRLAEMPIAAIHSSPLERCRETAAPLARALGLQVRVHRGLIETGYGDWTGRTIRQVARTRLWRTLQRSPSAIRFPGGESLREVQARAVDAAAEIARAAPERAAVLVTHADVVQMLLAHAAGVHLDLFQRFVVEPASVSAIWIGEGPGRIVTANDTGDLAHLVPRRRGRRRPVGG